MSELHDFVRGLRAWADEYSAARLQAEAGGQWHRLNVPLVTLDVGDEPQFSIWAHYVGDDTARAAIAGAFNGEPFRDLRPSLDSAGGGFKAVECLARFLRRTCDCQLSGPADADLRKMADALERMGRSKATSGEQRKPLVGLQEDVYRLLVKHTVKRDKYGMPRKCLAGREIADLLATQCGIRNQTDKSISKTIVRMRRNGWRIKNRRGGAGYYVDEPAGVKQG